VFKVIWDKKNTVRLTMSSKGEALNVSPRPVFFEELNLLGLNKMGWIYPESKNPLMWACDRRYFYNGEVVMEIKGGNIFDAPSIQIVPGKEHLSIVPIDIEYLRKMNEDSIFLLEHEAMDFINQTYRRYKGLRKITELNPDIDFQQLAQRLGKKTKEEHVVVKEECDSFDVMPLSEAEAQGKAPILSSKVDLFIASFSGGKDSQVVLDLVARVVPSEDFLVIYSDTGYELPTSLSLYKELEDYYHPQYPNLKFYSAENEQNVISYWEKLGSPSRMHRWCCGVMKTAPLYRKLKEIAALDKQPIVLAFEGVRAEESDRRAQYQRLGKGVKHNNVINARPILDWNSTEIYLYILLRNIPFNHAYREGFSRVGCSLCPFSSDWSEFLVSKKYPEAIKPFVDYLYKMTDALSIHTKKEKDDYIKSGNWKLRAGGKTSNTEGSSVQFITTSPDFKAELISPKENLLTWLKPLGKISIIDSTDESFSGAIDYLHNSYPLHIITKKEKTTVLIQNVGDNVIFQGLIKRVLYKTTYCIHCEVCEVECPSGALVVTPIVKINGQKCIQCKKCLTFKNRGCIMANSINISESLIKKNKTMATSGIDRYSTFGLKDKWISEFFSNYRTFFKGDNQLGTKMIPACVNWFRECEILDSKDKVISPLGDVLRQKYLDNPKTIWEILWINLSENSQAIKFYTSTIHFNREYTKPDILEMMQMQFENIAKNTLANPVGALCNMFGIGEETIIGDELKQGLIRVKGKTVDTVKRETYHELSMVAVAYSLYKYAEKQGRKSLTVSEFYNDNQTEGIYRQFGIDRITLEKLLRSIQEEEHHVLTVELNMGLDNINLRDDLTSFEILKALL
jgi:3'-phosphoadenosine 5'-phosphosulfate sulfotransferase (PAPS reductase)/FAD synthetase/ferredoxin